MTHKSVQLIREGEYLAEVPVRLEDVGDWGPCMGLAEIAKLDRVRNALRVGNMREALGEAKVFRLIPESEGERSALGFGENPQETIEP